jgi:L-alanine-DL-glutamate epimerase-like enolase superfamily enzyme
MPQILDLRAEPALYPMHSPFESALRRSTAAENVLVRATVGAITGFGEASPAAYVTGDSVESVLAGVPVAAEAVRGMELERVGRWSAALDEALPNAPTARCSIEMALLDALTQRWGIPLAHYFGGARDEVRTDLTIPICPPEEAGELAAKAAAKGYRSLKIKVGGADRQVDMERVSRCAPGAGLRLDANQAFAVEEALAFVNECLARGVPVEIMEQPVPAADLESLAAVTRRSPVPVIADEAVIDAAAALRVAAMGAAHGINIKLAKAGMLGALRIIAIARAAGLKLMIGCMLESLLGIGAAVHLAAGTGAFDYLDLDGHALIGLTPTGSPFAQEGDLLRPGSAPGLGWTP